MRLKISNFYSPNFSLPKRRKKMIKFIVIHYTGMKSESSAIKRLSFNSNKIFITKAFHRHFRQNLVNGIPDQECFLISKNLLKS